MVPRCQGRWRPKSDVIMIVETPLGCDWFGLGLGPVFEADVGDALRRGSLPRDGRLTHWVEELRRQLGTLGRLALERRSAELLAMKFAHIPLPPWAMEDWVFSIGASGII